jgi:hypothetical protein
LAAAAIIGAFRALAAEAIAVIMREHGPALTLESSRALYTLHDSMAADGALRGFIAGKILANGGLGYPDVKQPAVRVWVEAVVVGSIIGLIAGAKRWWAIPAIATAGAWGALAQQSPVALATILWGGAIGGVVALAIMISLDILSAPIEAR